jgi:aminoglycoside phosphotransferase (APT) family kinase protein
MAPANGWLPAVIPADARCFRAAEPEIRRSLDEAGAKLCDEAPDVAIGTLAEVGRDAPYVVVTLDASQPEGGSRTRRALRRLLQSLRVRLDASHARRELRRRGYRAIEVVFWDIQHVVQLPTASGDMPRLPVEMLPERALLIAGVGESLPPTVYQAVIAEAGRATGEGLAYRRPRASAGRLVTVFDDAVLRVAIGPAHRMMESQRQALEQLRVSGSSPFVHARVPWPLAGGRLGLAHWSLERRLSGSPHGQSLGEALLEDCLQFVVELHQAREGPGASPESLVHGAEVVAALDGAEGGAIVSLASTVEELLAGVPRGFAHGDFWNENLLTRGGRLLGVVDWDWAGAGRLPLLDLLHLTISARRLRTRAYLGDAIVSDALPWARRGGDELVHRYCQRIGFEVNPELLEALVVAYWIVQISRELETYSDRPSRPLWIKGNIAPLAALAKRARSRGSLGG